MKSRPDAAGRILGGPFVTLWVSIFLGTSQYHLLVPLVPLLLVDLGADAALIGLAALVFSLPSILFRPILGRAVDRRGPRLVVGAGEVILAVTALVFAIPALLAILVGRAIQGVGWAALNTGGYAFLGRLAPADRRAEASGYYSVAPAIAQLVMPGLGIGLYTVAGYPLAMLVGTITALLALTVMWHTRVPDPVDRVESTRSDRGLTERSAVLPMILESVHAATQSIFTFFMPVLVLASGVPVQALALYYPAYGVVAVTGRLFAPRLADRLGRDTTLIIGIALGLVALILGVLAPHFVVLAVAGCLAAGAGAILGPTLLALTIDRAPPSRIGAAVATYSMGYQIGAGFGGAVWGVMFATLGTASPFLAAAAVHVAVIGILWLRR